jgi:hypothetical protein
MAEEWSYLTGERLGRLSHSLVNSPHARASQGAAKTHGKHLAAFVFWLVAIFTFFVGSPGARGAEPQITGFSPAVVPPGQTVVLSGSGFATTSSVLIEGSRESVEAQFNVVSDTELQVTVPEVRAYWFENYAVRITVINPNGASVTLPTDATVVAEGQSVTAGGLAQYLVRSGGALSTGGAGSVWMYLQSGAAAETGGGGGHTIYMEKESVLNVGQGGVSGRIVKEPGAIIRVDGVIGDPPGSAIVEVPRLTFSQVSALLRVPPLPVITSAKVASGTVAEPFFYTVTAMQPGPQSLLFGATGLPSGLSIDPASGAISGTPAAAGTFEVMLQATNENSTATMVLTLSIGTSSTPVLSTAGVLLASSGQSLSFALQASNAPQRFAAEPLPEGLAIDPLTGTISGTPTVPGIYPVSVSAENEHGIGRGTLLVLVDRVQPVVTGFARDWGVRGDRLRVPEEAYWGDGRLSHRLPRWLRRGTLRGDLRHRARSPDSRRVHAPGFRSHQPDAGNHTGRSDRYGASRLSGSQNRDSALRLTFYIVKSGGSLTSGGGGSVIGYLERGASAQTGGGGGHAYFLEAGSTLNLSGGGGGHQVVQAAGARLIGHPGALLSVSSLTPSFPPRCCGFSQRRRS